MLLTIIQLIYFMLPAYFANMAPVFARKIPFLDTPVDLGKTLHGTRILGDHKTWRGLLAGLLLGTLVAFLQYLALPIALDISLPDYRMWWVIGPLLSIGALSGDLIKSFFKRRLHITSGAPWIPFDQIDYAIGAVALCSIAYFPGWTNSALIILISVVLHFLTNIIGYYLNIRTHPW